MADFDYSPYEGKTLKADDGTLYTVKGGKLLDSSGKETTYTPPADTSDEDTPSPWQDIKQGALPWAGQAAAGFAGTPAALANMAGKGESWLADKASGIFPESLTEGMKHEGEAISNSSFVKNWSPEALTGENSFLGRNISDINYQPQTRLGGLVRTAEGFVPATAAAALLGPEALAPTLIRGAGGALGSEAAGQLVEDYTGPNSGAGSVARMAGALIGGGFAPRAVTPFPAGAARTAMAGDVQKAIEPYGGNVEAAQATGSGRLRSMQGETQPQDQAVTQALFDKAGVPYNPTSTSKLSDDIANEMGQWKQQANAIAKNTNVQPDAQFWDKFRGPNNPDSIAAQANKAFAHDPGALKEFNDAADNFNAGGIVSRQGGPGNIPVINGPEYTNFLDRYGGSSNRYVKQLVGELQNTAERSPGGQVWTQSNERFANLKGLENAAKNAGPNRTINPSDVTAGMYKSTQMRDLADSMDQILTPVKKAPSTGLGKAAAGIGGAVLGSHFGSAEGGGVLGLLAAEAGKKAMGRMSQALARTGPVNTYLKNQLLLPQRLGAGPLGSYGPRLSQRQAAALLSQPASLYRPGQEQ